MNSRRSARPLFRTAASFLVALVMLGLSGLIGASVAVAITPAVAADVTGQFSDSLLTSGDLGTAPRFVSDATVVRTPDATLAGPEGVAAYIDSLRGTYPNARFSVDGFEIVGSLIIVDWQGTADGTVVVPGRTLITVEDGMIAEIAFLNLNSVAPVAGASTTSESAPALNVVIVDEQGKAFVAEHPDTSLDVTAPAPASFATDAEQDPDIDRAITTASSGSPTWEDLDPNTIAERRAGVVAGLPGESAHDRATRPFDAAGFDPSAGD